jgi:hypothetical protein
MMKVVATALAVASALVGCAEKDLRGFAVSDLRKAIATQEVIELKNFTAFSWDRVHFFAPYTAPNIIKKEVGKEIPFPHSSSEGYCLVVFMAGSTVAGSFEVGRSDADFSTLFRPGGYRREETKFTVEKNSDGWKKLCSICKEPSAFDSKGFLVGAAAALISLSRRGSRFSRRQMRW